MRHITRFNSKAVQVVKKRPRARVALCKCGALYLRYDRSLDTHRGSMTCIQNTIKRLGQLAIGEKSKIQL